MAYNLVSVQTSVICDAVKFLVLKTQQPDGMFVEVGEIIHGEMIVRASNINFFKGYVVYYHCI